MIVKAKKGISILVILAAALVVMAISLDEHYYATSPRTPNPATGRVYPLTIHGGTLVYLTYVERLPLQYGWLSCLVFFPAAFYLFRKKRSEKKQTNAAASRPEQIG